MRPVGFCNHIDEVEGAAATEGRGLRTPRSPCATRLRFELQILQHATVVKSVAHITMAWQRSMRKIHNTGNNPHRMPAILHKEDFDTWLHGSVEDARAVLRQYEPDHMYAYEVSPRVNSPKNDSPELIEPVDSR